MSPTYRHEFKDFHSTVQRAKDRRQKFHFCRLPFDVRPRNVKLNLSIEAIGPLQDPVTWYRINYTGTQITFLCFGSPTASFASQCNIFRTM